jgi:hypothetical protein
MSDKTFYGRLKRLFNTNVVIRTVGKNKLRVVDNDHLQSVGNAHNSKFIDRFTRLHGVRPNSLSTYNPNYNYFSSKTELYTDYEVMDQDSILASALDIYSDETVMKDDFGDVLRITSDNDAIKRVLHNLFYDILNVEFNLWPWVRNMCKYGDLYLKLDIQEGIGIINVTPLSAYEIVREEGLDLNNPYHVQFKQLGSGNIIYENFEIAHFRLLNDSNFLPYGKSILEPARRVWKQLTLMEDAMLIHRIMRAPEKRIFKIDVGNIPAGEVDNHMERIMNQMRKTPYVDPQTGDYNLKFNMMNMLEDYFLPVRGGQSGTEIDTLSGMEFTGIDDIEYLRNKMMAALKVPKAFLGYEEGLCISPDTLIPLISGEEKTVLQLIEDYELGIKNYVYSIDEDSKLIVPGEIEWAGFTRMNAKVVRVHLDNGKYIDCTPDHNFLTRDGEWIEAQNLVANQSLMPLYTRLSAEKNISGYTEVYHPGTGKWEMVHRLVANHYGIKQTGKVIHHIDLNKWNNNPENLDGSMSFFEHRKFHQELAKQGNYSKAMLEYRNSDRIKINASINGKKGGDISGKRLGEWVKANGPANKGLRSLQYHSCKNCNTMNYNKEFCNTKCWGDFYKGNTYNCKFNSITFENLVSIANQSNSFKDLESKLKVTRNTLNRIFDKFDIDRYSFVDTHMPLAKVNKGFINNFKGEYANHKVVNVEFLSEQIDTCDLTITKYHNFATSAGVIIHNSGKATLAAEDVRFARTVERIQRIVISELHKIAIIHLYSQGYENAELINFELDMTSPSTIYEQEKLTLYNTKVDLAKSMIEGKLLPTDWIYKNLFNFTPDEIDVIKEDIITDQKNTFRLTKIAEEGEDPADPRNQEAKKEGEEGEEGEEGGNPFAAGGGEEKEGEEGGGEEGEEGGGGNPFASGDKEKEATVQDSVDLKLQKKYDSEAKKKRTPKGGWPGAGRPKEGIKYNTHEHPRGYDPMGRIAWKNSRTGKFRNESVNVIDKYGLSKFTKKSTLLSETSMLDEGNIIE